MGVITLPIRGSIYIDAQILIYSVEKHPKYSQAIRPMWEAAGAGSIEVVTSELSLLEVLVAPLRDGNDELVAQYELLLRQRGLRAIPLDTSILREAARLRALVSSLRTPDAIHAATGLERQCEMFLTNDRGFRRVPRLPVVILEELLNA